MLPVLRLILLAVFACAASALPGCADRDRGPTGASTPRNVVLFIGDGFGPGAWAVALAYARAHGIDVVLDEPEHSGLLETASADALVTDSAAAATAWATGQAGKQDEVGLAGVPNLFERLAHRGSARGFVTTTRVTHGTLAPFYARNTDRDAETEIAAELLANLPTVAMGGGRREFLPKSAGGHREDERDLLAAIDPDSVLVLEQLAQPLPAGKKVLLLASASHLPHETDRGEEPDLADMAVAALRRLRAERDGWFLLVEEGRIDHAGHSHDAASLALDVVRLDRAVAAALREVDLATTAIVVTADHGTGNPNLHERAKPESLDVVSMSVERMTRKIFDGKRWNGTPAALEAKAFPVLAEGARHAGLRGVDMDRLLTASDDYERQVALGTAVSRRFGITFMAWEDRIESPAVDGHTGEPVAIRAWGVRSAEIRGLRDHAALGRWIADVLGLPPAGAPPPAS